MNDLLEQIIMINDEVKNNGSVYFVFDRNSNTITIKIEWIMMKVYGYSETFSVEEVRRSRVDILCYFLKRANIYYNKKVSKNSVFSSIGK